MFILFYEQVQPIVMLFMNNFPFCLLEFPISLLVTMVPVWRGPSCTSSQQGREHRFLCSHFAPHSWVPFLCQRHPRSLPDVFLQLAHVRGPASARDVITSRVYGRSDVISGLSPSGTQRKPHEACHCGGPSPPRLVR